MNEIPSDLSTPSGRDQSTPSGRDPLPYPPHDPRPAARDADGNVIDGPAVPAPAAPPVPPAAGPEAPHEDIQSADPPPAHEEE